MSELLLESLRLWSPEVILGVGAMVVMLLGGPRATRLARLVVACAAVALAWAQRPSSAEPFFGLIILDPFANVFRWAALATIGLVVLMASSSSEVDERWRGEYLGVLLVVGVGLMLMAQANHLLMAYLAMETVSLGSYLLVALVRDGRASEAALKYLLFGALSSGVMLFGMSWLFGLSGQLAFSSIRASLAGVGPPLAQACVFAVGLMVVGLAFKISMVPFHMWTPDVYEGAPVPVTALLSVGPKAAGLALLLRLAGVLQPLWGMVAPVVVVLAMVTMTLGNVAALVQQNVKRLLAYSTIGQVGYLLIGLSVHTPRGLEALLVYLAAYLFMNLGLFACVTAVVQHTGDETVSAFRGLAKRSPVLALCCALFLLSLAGLPPLFGFIGKFLLFGAAIDAQLIALAVVGVLNSAVALYYYVNIIRQMYLLAPERSGPLRVSRPVRLALAVCAAATMLLGVFPGPLLSWLGGVVAGVL